MSARRCVGVSVCILCALMSGCAKPYTKAIVRPTNHNNALTGFSFDEKDGCSITVAIRGVAGTGTVKVPKQWCKDATVAEAAVASIPKPEPKRVEDAK